MKKNTLISEDRPKCIFSSKNLKTPSNVSMASIENVSAKQATSCLDPCLVSLKRFSKNITNTFID